jgi:hypothetical protein
MRAGVEFGKPVGVYGTKSVSRVKHPNMNLFPNGKTLRLKTWRNNYVRMRSNGKHVHQGGAGSEEIFQVKRLPQFGANCVALYGRFKRYLRAHSNKKTIDQSGVRSNYNSYPNGWTWERFWLEDVGGGKIALRTYHGTYLRAHSNGWMDQSGVRPKGQTIPSGWVWEKFTPVFIGGTKSVSRVKYPNMNLFPNGKILRLKTWRNNYVRMRSNGKHVHQGGAGSEEIFQLKRLPQFGPNAIALYGRFKRYLRAHGNKKTIDQSGVRSNYNSYPNGWSWERFWLEDVGGGKIALRTYHGTYLRANRNGWMDQSSVRPKGQTIPSGWVWEKFTPVFIGVSKKVVPKLSDSTILSGLTMLISGSLKLMQTSPKDKERAKKIYARVYTAAKKTVERRKSLSNEVKAAVNKFKSDALKIINPQNLSKEQQKGANLSNLQNIPTDISEIQLSETDSSVGKTSDLKAPDMNMNPDLKDDTKFELFINGKEINNNSNLWLVILVTLFLIGICNLK